MVTMIFSNIVSMVGNFLKDEILLNLVGNDQQNLLFSTLHKHSFV